MAKISLPDIAAQFASAAALNDRFSKIETALNGEVLYRDNPEGEPNEMKNLLDMNFNRIINLPYAASSSEPATLGQVIAVVNDIIAGGDGSNVGSGGVSYDTEFVTLAEGQTVVVFASDTTLSNFSISGLSADNGKLFEGTGYTINHGTRTLTLAQSYPAGTALSRYRENPDEDLPVSAAIDAAGYAQEWANNAEDVLVSGAAGGNQSDDYSARHHAAKAQAAADAVGSLEGQVTNGAASGAVVLDAADGANSVFNITLAGNITDLSITNVPSDVTKAYGATIIITSDGSSTVTFGSQFTFVNATPPTLSTTAGKRDFVVGITVNQGTEFMAELGISEI
jgi:hypothetical protein